MSWRKQIARRTNSLHPSLRICLLVLFGSFFGSTSAQTIYADVLVTGAGLPFAIADFDGDLRPDLMVVQSVSNRDSVTGYRVEIRLSTGGRQSIYLAEPSGGLRIAARDVNGDHIPDLIISSAARDESLAVFFNDGRGAFRWANPSTYSRASVKSKKLLIYELPRLMDTVATPSQSSNPDFSGTKYFLHPRPIADSVPRANFASFLGLLLVSLLERAPPKLSRTCSSNAGVQSGGLRPRATLWIREAKPSFLNKSLA